MDHAIEVTLAVLLGALILLPFALAGIFLDRRGKMQAEERHRQWAEELSTRRLKDHPQYATEQKDSEILGPWLKVYRDASAGWTEIGHIRADPQGFRISPESPVKPVVDSARTVDKAISKLIQAVEEHDQKMREWTEAEARNAEQLKAWDDSH